MQVEIAKQPVHAFILSAIMTAIDDIILTFKNELVTLLRHHPSYSSCQEILINCSVVAMPTLKTSHMDEIVKKMKGKKNESEV